MPADELRAVAAGIKAGVPPSFDEASLRKLQAKLEDLPPIRGPVSCRIAGWGLVVSMVALLGFVAVLYGYCLRGG
jgi:hypothetical protein